MTELSLSPSAAEDFTAEEVDIELPRRNAAGKVLVVRLRTLGQVDLAEALDGMTGKRIGPAPDTSELHPDALKDMEKDENEKVERLLRRTIVSPQFSFAEGEPGVPWGSLHVQNQMAIYTAVLHSSAHQLPEGAEKALSFRYLQRGGVAVRSGGAVDLPATAPAA